MIQRLETLYCLLKYSIYVDGCWLGEGRNWRERFVVRKVEKSQWRFASYHECQIWPRILGNTLKVTEYFGPRKGLVAPVEGTIFIFERGIAVK